MSIEDATKAITSVVAKGNQERFDRTWLGSLLGQMLMMLTTIAGIAAALVFIYGKVQEISPDLLRKPWFWILLVSLPVVAFVFLVVPTTLQARRERRLRSLTITDAARAPGQFRLHPYGPRDKDQYTRPDHADDKAVTWLEGTDRTLLYLSGASGSGKSSLLGAAVLPRLQATGWRCVTLRVYADPARQLRDALLANKELFPKPPAANTAIRTLLERAAGTRTDSRILIVIDQFEEFLILNDEAARAPFVDLLRALDTTPIANLRLLLVFRSDYRELLFKLGLPAYVSGQNAFDLAAFWRPEAEAFLRGSGRLLATEGYDALFAGLDRVEEAPGLYRPITLNMVGLVLERMGGRVTGDPARLIEQYLKSCVAAGPSRDFAAPVLRQMITSSGTKEPRDVADLAAATGFAPWQVESTLADLDAQGLVRPLDPARTRWEISHDFLARQIGILLGRLRPSWVRRAAPIAVPSAAVGWATALFLLLIWWPSQREKVALAEMRQLGLVQISDPRGEIFPAKGEWIAVTGDKFDDAALLKFMELNRRIGKPIFNLSISGVTSLDPLRGMPLTSLLLSDTDITSLEPLKGMSLTSLALSDADGITSLGPLKGMPLTSLDLSDADGITSLEPLKGMPLTSLDLSYAGGITSLEPLKGMPLTSLNLSDADGITSLEPLKGMPLTSLDLSYAGGITSLEPLEGMPLTSLDLSSAAWITSLEPLKGMSLTSLDLSSVDGITSLEPLKGMPLTSLDLSSAAWITSLEPLKGMSLTSLDLYSVGGITSLEPLKGMPLTSLNLSFTGGITDLEPLKGMPLTSLDLSYAGGITSLEPLKGMPLTSLGLSSVDGITTLEPLKGMNPAFITGATQALLATLR